MSCRHEPGEPWYDLIRSALEEEAARTALSPAQAQALLERLKKRKNFFQSIKPNGGGLVPYP